MNSGVSKKTRATKMFAANIGLFYCPLCGGDLAVRNEGVNCSLNHSFDVARKGYLNLFTGPQTGLYGKELFVARQEVFDAGVYDPLIDAVAGLIKQCNPETPLLLDAGCGEGSFLKRMGEHLKEATLLGIDISRDGIRLATSHHEPIMWCVADLAKLPLRAQSIDFVLNVLSPANYGEFRRVLKPGGALIKVLPGKEYLAEVRERLEGVVAYSNEGVMARLEDNIEVKKRLDLRYSVSVTRQLWNAMVQMTPLTQHRQARNGAPKAVTIDLEIVQGFPVALSKSL